MAASKRTQFINDFLRVVSLTRESAVANSGLIIDPFGPAIAKEAEDARRKFIETWAPKEETNGEA